ncbi:hypothetical protein UPYG_G00315590 [Umbra pygmaea]|uniref:Gypsy retrotransposon integrase-like protein 1 n=1 Tax=Umbra pygmaea TaxID=75934 RepID=A0ABD0W0T1_UMBPY
MPVPQDVPAMQRFLGMVNYLGKFIPNYSDIAAPLRQLTHKDTAWCWFPQHQQAFDRLKSCLSSSPVLSYYDVKKPVTLTCDASCYGLGAACLQEGRPVAYASRTLTDTETRYAQIEKELLAVVFACIKFKDYVYGKPIVVETDHQPLVTILKKPIHTAPARLQRMLLQLQTYDITLVYKRGKQMYLADTLSRAPNKTSQCPATEDTFEVMCVSYISTNRLEELGHTQPRIRDELVVDDGIVIKGQRTVIPHSLHREYINIIHRGHPGLESTKRRARSTVFWPTMNNDIEEELLSCSGLHSTRPHQQRNLYYHIRFQSCHGPRLLLICSSGTDNSTKCWSTRTQDDNARQYTSQRFKDFAKQWDFVHVTSSPEYPQSNGLAERAVRSAKQLMEKSHRDGTDVFLNLLNVRNIPRDQALGSPAERLMSRQIRSTLPVNNRLLEPAPKNTKQVIAQLQNKRLAQKRYYDISSRPLQPLVDGQVVRMQTKSGHDRLGTVKGRCKEPRSYIIESDGGTYRRNRRHILPVAGDTTTTGGPCRPPSSGCQPSCTRQSPSYAANTSTVSGDTSAIHQ